MKNYKTKSAKSFLWYWFLRMLIIPFAFILFFSCNQKNYNVLSNLSTKKHHLSIRNWDFKCGDSIHWASPSYSGPGWESMSKENPISCKNEIIWLRKSIKLIQNEENRTWQLTITGLTLSYDIYWDDELIVNNRLIPVNSKTNIKKKTSFSISLNKFDVNKLDHLIALRINNSNKTESLQQFNTTLDSIANQTRISDWVGRSYFLFGGLTIAIFMGLALYLAGGRYKSYLFFTIFCLVLLIWQILIFLNISGNSKIISLVAYLQPFVVAVIEIIIALFVLFFFNFEKKKMHFGIIFLILIIKFLFQIETFSWITVVYIFSLLAYSVYKRIPGSMYFLIGYIIFSIPILINAFIFSLEFFLSMPLLIGITLSISSQLKQTNKDLISSELRSQRLEIELLRKSIQPHFIMNSLNSVKSWLKSNPVKGERLIQALASEFRIIEKVSGQKLITIIQELELCDFHLEVMGSRREAEYLLIREGISEKDQIPPLVFLTLIENGLTHAFQPMESGNFNLKCTHIKNRVIYQLENQGSMVSNISKKTNDEVEEGMGIKYVKVRLEEAFPGKWNLEYGIIDGCWQITMTINS